MHCDILTCNVIRYYFYPFKIQILNNLLIMSEKNRSSQKYVEWFNKIQNITVYKIPFFSTLSLHKKLLLSTVALFFFLILKFLIREKIKYCVIFKIKLKCLKQKENFILIYSEGLLSKNTFKNVNCTQSCTVYFFLGKTSKLMIQSSLFNQKILLDFVNCESRKICVFIISKIELSW